MIKVKKANFFISATSIENAPSESLSEVAFLGRSNVGKSSLLNSLTDRKNLAKSSSTPGKTRLINFFEVEFVANENIYPLRFVDLPGFGYAKASKSLKEQWQKSLTKFLQNRASIRVFILLRDARHPNLKIDEDAKLFLESIKNPDQRVIDVFTKIDKLKQKELSKLKRDFKDAIFVSNLKKIGIEKLKKEILNSIFGDIYANSL